MPEAATPTGGAEGSARPSTAAQQPSQGQAQEPAKPATIHDKIKAAIFAPEQTDTVTQPPAQQQARTTTGEFAKGTETVAEKAQEPDPQGVDDEAEANPDRDGEASDEPSIKSLNELAEGLGWDLDRVLDLEAATKINGKDGKVPLRDILKSHQLEGHLNQGLMKLAEERKAFEAETSRKVSEMQARTGQLSQVVTLAQKILDGEFADVNWQELQRTDPNAFQAKYGAYKMRVDAIQQLNQTVMQEQERASAQQKAAYEAYLAEQGKLLDSKIPEWADKGKRDKDVAEMVAILNDAYGLTEQEVRSSADHRLILLARDAMRWQKLQKSKPATLNKVRTAPKLIRPGTQQSRSAQEGLSVQKDRDTLRRTGRVQDAFAPLKRHLFPS